MRGCLISSLTNFIDENQMMHLFPHYMDGLYVRPYSLLVARPKCLYQRHFWDVRLYWSSLLRLNKVLLIYTLLKLKRHRYRGIKYRSNATYFIITHSQVYWFSNIKFYIRARSSVIWWSMPLPTTFYCLTSSRQLVYNTIINKRFTLY